MVHAAQQPILRRVNRLILSLGDLTVADEVRAEQARSMARQMDASAPGGSGALAQALPSINRELTLMLEKLLAAHRPDDPFLDQLFRNDDDGTDVRITMRAVRAIL